MESHAHTMIENTTTPMVPFTNRVGSMEQLLSDPMQDGDN
jgi:hypothetical protein